MSKKLTVLIILATSLTGLVLLFRSTAAADLLWNLSNSGQWLLPLVTVSALIDAINPCAFSVLLLTIAFLYSIGRLRGNILRIGGFYILGIFLAYVLIGFGLLQAFHIFGVPNFMGKLGASLVIILGAVNIATALKPTFPLRLKIPTISHHRIASLMEMASQPTALFLGVLVGLCEFPCTGGPYLMVIGLLHDQTTFISGALYLLLYNLVFVLPLAVILLIVGDTKILKKLQHWRSKNLKQSRLIGGIVMLLLGSVIWLI